MRERSDRSDAMSQQGPKSIAEIQRDAKARKRRERRERSEPPGASEAQGSEAKEPPERRPGATRVNCPWWWCVWFRDVFPAVHNHPKQTPPWWKHTVDLSPATANRIVEIAKRSIESGDRALLPPPDLLEAAVRHALRTEKGGERGRSGELLVSVTDAEVDAEMERLLGRRRDESGAWREREEPET